MTEIEIDSSPDFKRGQWMLEHQIFGPSNLIQFWAVFGTYAR